jgi:hypothetical protein
VFTLDKLFQSGVDGLGSPWWKVTRYFIRTDSVIAHLFLVLLARERQYQQGNFSVQAHNYLHTGIVFCFMWRAEFSVVRTYILLVATWDFSCIPCITEHHTAPHFHLH